MAVGGTRAAALVASTLTAVVLAGAAVAQEDPVGAPEVVRASVVELRPAEGAAVVYQDRRYAGTMRVSGHGGGLAIVEAVSLDDYLAGIQEVPFSWEPAALEAQAIAARTYLAWTLARGRTETGRRYGFDICATDACQVYAGLEPRLGTGGDRWLAAVSATRDQILLYDGAPALTYYSSTSGGRTRTVGDVFVGDADRPYLQAVESPGEDSPFASWSWWLTSVTMQEVMEEAGLVSGRLLDISTTVTEDGEGPWTVQVSSEGGTRTVTTWELRGILNRAGPAVAPGLLPALRPDGPRYPQTILSPTFTMSSLEVPIPSPLGPVGSFTLYEVQGRGWGHLVGMSQYGAQAMAGRGSSASDILAHFYGGLRPTESPGTIPDLVEVALATSASELDVNVTGPVTVLLDGEVVATDELGAWSMSADAGSVVVTAPVGLGLPPRIRPGRIYFDGLRLYLRPEVTAAADVEWRLSLDGTELASFGPEPMDAGLLMIPIPLQPGRLGLSITATNAHGGDLVLVGEIADRGGTDGDDADEG